MTFLAYLVPCQPENNANKVPRLFFRNMGTKTFASSQKHYDFWPKTAKFGPIYAFLVILGKFDPMSAQKNNANKVAGWFSDKWVPEILLPPNMIRINGPKMARFGPKLAFFDKYWHF